MQPAQERGGEKTAAMPLRYVGRLGWNVSLGLLLLLGVTQSTVTGQTGEKSQVQPSSPAPTMDLHRGEVIPFNTPGPHVITSKIKCGPGGDIYAIYSSTREISSAPVRRISVSSRSVTDYPIRTISGYKILARASFDVSADGTLYALFQAMPQSGSDSKPDPVYLIVKYKDDGQVDSYFPLGDVPGKQMQPTSIAMFGADNALVSGTTLLKNPGGTSLGVFSATFDRGGTFRAPVTLMKLDAPAKSSASSKSPDPNSPDHGDAISLASSLYSFSASDGNVYVLQGGRLDVVSPFGSIEHEFDLPPPADKLIPFQMASIGASHLFVRYDHLSTGDLAEDNKYRGIITVVQSQTGEVTFVYRMPQDENDFAVAACAASLSDFLFLGSDDHNNLQVVHYLPK
jgi:hypothetical protein